MLGPHIILKHFNFFYSSPITWASSWNYWQRWVFPVDSSGVRSSLSLFSLHVFKFTQFFGRAPFAGQVGTRDRSIHCVGSVWKHLDQLMDDLPPLFISLRRTRVLLQVSLIKQLGGLGAQRIGDMNLGLSAPWLEFLFLCRFTVSRWANRVLCLFVSYALRGNHGVLPSGVARLNHSGSETL